MLQFRLKLALRLGKTLQELDKMPASEIYLWIAYDGLSPIGDERGDIHAAQISSSVYQSQGSKVKLNDVLIKWQKEEKDEIKQAHNFFKNIQKVQKNG